MAYEIAILSAPRHARNERTSLLLDAQALTLGRAADNTWVLDDPERFISSRHARISFESGQYYLTDLSTNGTFHNGSGEPIGNGNRVPLKNGDRFGLGDYEFEVRAVEDVLPAGVIGQHADALPPLSEEPPRPFLDGSDDPFASPPPPGAASLGLEEEELDPLAALDRSTRGPAYEIGVSQPDHAPPLQHAVAWPHAIPDDWDLEAPLARPPAAPAPSYAPAETLAATTARLRESEQQLEAARRENQALLAELAQLKHVLAQRASQPASTAPLSADGATLVESLGLRADSLSPQKKAEIHAIAGPLLRECILGLMQALSFRKRIKEEFRINVTTIKPVENNPLKFSADLDDALSNMFLKDSVAYMSPVEAVREGFLGVSEHQIAVLAGIQAAFRGMIDRLDPDALEQRFEKYRRGTVIKVGIKGRNWESYKAFHREIAQDPDSAFQTLFGYDFMNAYEDQLHRLVLSRKAKINE